MRRLVMRTALLTGLDDYNARFYDPVAGQFARADSVADGLSRYGYVSGNPETWTDPSGHVIVCGADCNGGNTGGTGCTSNCQPVCHINCDHHGGTTPGGTGGTGGTTVDALVTSQPLFNSDNLCVADNYVQEAATDFVIAGALAAVAVSSGFAVGAFSGYRKDEASNPAYFQKYTDDVHSALDIGTLVGLFTGLAGLLTKATGQTEAALDGPEGFAALEDLATTTITLAGFSIGLAVGSLMILAVLIPIADHIIGVQRDPVFGSEQDCGNNDYGLDIVCPTMSTST